MTCLLQVDKKRLKRLANEKEQNELLKEKVRNSPSTMGIVKYGDIIQLEHVRSGKFVGMHTGHSLTNENNQTVELMEEAEEGNGCYFKVQYPFYSLYIALNLQSVSIGITAL